MHIHANNNLALATLGAVRNDVQEMAAKRAAEVRRKLSSPLTGLAGAGDGVEGVGAREQEADRSLDKSPDGSPERQVEQEAGEQFGRLFSVRA